MGEATRLAELLAAAVRTTERLEPAQALARVETGATLVDIRSSDARRRDGAVPGALHIPRTVLEWRLEPGGASRTPYVPEGTPVVLLCDQGYSSIFAAAALVAMGVDAADVVGGFEAWRDAGLPVVAWATRGSGTRSGRGCAHARLDTRDTLWSNDLVE